MAYGEILPQAVLDLPAIAPVNLHFSLLPELRGASPVQTALLEGRAETGVTTIVMDAGMDTGPVILQRAEAIEPGDDAGSLGDRLASIGAEVLVETVDRFAGGAVEPRPQDEEAATFTEAPRRRRPRPAVERDPPATSSTARARWRPSRARRRGSAART